MHVAGRYDTRHDGEGGGGQGGHDLPQNEQGESSGDRNGEEKSWVRNAVAAANEQLGVCLLVSLGSCCAVWVSLPSCFLFSLCTCVYSMYVRRAGFPAGPRGLLHMLKLLCRQIDILQYIILQPHGGVPTFSLNDCGIVALSEHRQYVTLLIEYGSAPPQDPSGV